MVIRYVATSVKAFDILAGIVPATFLLPLSAGGVVFGSVGLPAWYYLPNPLLLLGMGGLVGTMGLWLAVLLGPRRVKRNGKLRVVVLACLVFGTISAALLVVLFGFDLLRRYSKDDAFTLLILIGPCVVSCRHMYLLLHSGALANQRDGADRVKLRRQF